jgi:hypothetical protein
MKVWKMTDDILTNLFEPNDKMTHGILYLNERWNDSILVFSEGEDFLWNHLCDS